MKHLKHLKHKPVAIILLAAVVLGLGAALYLYSKSSALRSPAGNSPKPALTVTTARPERASLPIRLAANGNITAWQEALIGSESGGLRLTEVRANVGDRVRAGQVLASFALESVQAEVAQSRASVAEAEANALDAAGNADKARTLETSGALSEQQIKQYITAEKTARARLEAARAMLTVQQVRLRQTQLLAPDDGVISSRSATVGAVVGAGTELFRMIRGGRLEWRAEVTSGELGRLAVGTPATIVAANGVEVKGRVRMIAPTVDAQTRSALVYVDLPTPVGKLNSPASGTATLNAVVKAGMFARGEFDLGASDALTVQQQSVVIRDGFSYVFVLAPDGHVSQAKVQIGRRLADRLEVLSGVPPDAELVASGAGFLNDGDLVRKVATSTANRPTSESNRPSAQAARSQSAIK